MAVFSTISKIKKYIDRFPQAHPDADRFIGQLANGKVEKGTYFIIGIRKPDGTLKQTEFEMNDDDIMIIEILKKAL
ncbi:MAG: hypothetical protein IJM15_05140 [Erysipelotrichaceae bacterium]|nr:hypothetical protein [Erysipelotrichaceae bacterium]